jgi:hypothetical protein
MVPGWSRSQIACKAAGSPQEANPLDSATSSGVIGSRAWRGEVPALITSRSKIAIEYWGLSASARSRATFASAPLPCCQATKASSR